MSENTMGGAGFGGAPARLIIEKPGQPDPGLELKRYARGEKEVNQVFLMEAAQHIHELELELERLRDFVSSATAHGIVAMGPWLQLGHQLGVFVASGETNEQGQAVLVESWRVRNDPA